MVSSSVAFSEAHRGPDLHLGVLALGALAARSFDPDADVGAELPSGTRP